MRRLAIASAAIICIGAPVTAGAQNRSGEILIIPLAGQIDGPLTAAPQRFTQSLAKIAESTTGTRTMSARVAKSDITTLVGCGQETEECYAEVARTLGVNELVFGRVKRRADGKLDVTLTRVRPASKHKPRTRTFDVTGDSIDAAQKEFELKAGRFLAEKEIDDPTTATPAVTTPPVPVESPGFSFDRVKRYTWGITIGAAGAILLGGVLLALASSKQADVDDAATSSVEDLRRLEGLESSGKRLTTAGNSLVIVGAVGVVAGGVLMYLQGSAKPTAEKKTLSVGPTAAGGLAVMVSGRF